MAVGTLHEIAPDLLLVEGRHPHTLWGDPDLPTVAVYRSGPRLYLLDTGAGPEQLAAIRAAAARFADVGEVEEVLLLNSHGHVDHLGNNHVLREIPAARRRHHIPRAARPALDHAAFFAAMYRSGIGWFDYLDGLDLRPELIADLLRALGAPAALSADDVADLGARMAHLRPALRDFVPSLVVDVLLRTYPAVHPSVETMVDYEELGPAGEIAIGSTRWTGWTFADETGTPEVQVLQSAGHSAGGVVYHLPAARFLLLADETSALPYWTDSDPRRTVETARRAITLLDEGLLDGICAGHFPMLPARGGEARARLQQIVDTAGEFTAAVEAVLRRHPDGLCVDALFAELVATAGPRSVITVQVGLQFPVFATFLKLTLLNHCRLLGLPTGTDAAGRPTFRLPRAVRLHPDPVFDGLLADPGAADPAAVSAAARRITAGDLPGWERFWRGEGDRAVAAADDRLAADDVPGARHALLAATDAYDLAARPLPADAEEARANRAAQAAAFRAAIPLLPTEVVALGTTGYRFGTTGATCVAVPLPAGRPLEAGYSRFAAAAADHALDCLVTTDPDLPHDGRYVVLTRAPEGHLTSWHPTTGRLDHPPGTTVRAAMTTIARRSGSGG